MWHSLKQQCLISHIPHKDNMNKKPMLVRPWNKSASRRNKAHSSQCGLWGSPRDQYLRTFWCWLQPETESAWEAGQPSTAQHSKAGKRLQFPNRWNPTVAVPLPEQIMISIRRYLFNINEIFNEVPNCRLISPSRISSGEI